MKRVTTYAILMLIVLMGCTQQTIIEGERDIEPLEVPVAAAVQYESDPEVIVVYDEPDAGRAVFAITDAPVQMEDIHELWITVDKVEIHSDARGWIVVSDEGRRYDVLQLREDGEEGILADVALEPGEYQQVRLSISAIEVVDARGEHAAVLPSGTLRFTSPFTVREDALTYVVFDFDLSQSLHLTGNGRYVLAPVIRVLVAENAAIRILATERIVVREGAPQEIVIIGTDAEGNVGVDERIPVDVTVRIEGGAGGERIIVVNNTQVVNNTRIVNNTRTVVNTTVRVNGSANLT